MVYSMTDVLWRVNWALTSNSPVAGAREKMSSLRSRFDQLTSSIARHEARVSRQTSQLAKMNRRGDPNEDAGNIMSQEQANGEADAEQPIKIPITAEDLEKEEQEIRDLERKKRALEDRVSGMERDLGGLMR